MSSARKLLRRLGTALVALLMLAGGGLVFWNVFVQGPYGDSCSHSLGCRSYFCLRHELAGEAQVAAPGHCTKSCDRDDECGSGTRCVVLGDEARDDLPPFGKPTRACMHVR
jgi:hypothetical protein